MGKMENGKWRMEKRSDRNRAGVFSGGKSSAWVPHPFQGWGTDSNADD